MISKAQKIDSDEEVEGNYFYKDIGVININKIYSNLNNKEYEIDPSTLKHSFDNGKTWRTEEEITSDLLAMDALRRLKDK